MWVIPPHANGEFVARMEHVLDVYKRPYDPLHPGVCMDESPRQLIRETRRPLPGQPGAVERYDYEYERCGVCSIFMAAEPLAGRRIVQIKERRTKIDWALFLKDVARRYCRAEKITLVMLIFYSSQMGVPCSRAVQSRLGSLGTRRAGRPHGGWDGHPDCLEYLPADALNRTAQDVVGVVVAHLHFLQCGEVP